MSAASIFLPRGFKGAAATAGIKASGKPDLVLLMSELPATVAGVFTTSSAAAAPVIVSRSRVADGKARAVVVNAGCANAATGERGLKDAIRMSEYAANALDIPVDETCVCSTGLIGSFLPMLKVETGIDIAAKSLGYEDDPIATAIMTTDTRPKIASIQHPDGWRVGGVAKGAGMIAPNMATMLAFITTDAKVDSALLREVMREVTAETFNSITIDGDTSTNDTFLCFANGASGIAPSREAFSAALRMVAGSLAEQIVADGEGATKLVRIRVRGAAEDAEARSAARTVAESVLVKTALFGEDPNWGRIVAALGRSGARMDLSKMSISIGGIGVLTEGQPAGDSALALARAAMKSHEFAIVADLFVGGGTAEFLTSDLSVDYVKFNADYET
ncbi:MAG TPA: bifunctional glutamate N-acetyltransferase/amino-acid acetyltransferase ArgJ [Actinomycetota bacterium]|nr:bifunctional glutamate N-acetyltransferase/amino-acid acetyltransferase ArgJ [Actinomycetota bacterium]